MFDAVRNNKKIVQIFLLLITLPFAFWGVDSYVKNAGNGDSLASVGGNSISMNEFQQAMREQQDRLRASMGENFNPAMLETPEARKAVLDNLINQRLLALDASKMHLSVADQQLRQAIAEIPAFQDNGQFSLPRYEAVLKAQGMTQAVFESRVRSDLALKQVLGAVAEGVMVSGNSVGQVYSVQFEERVVSEARLAAAQYAGSVKLADEAARKFYDENRRRFELPAQVRVEYLVLGPDEVASQLSISDADARKEYDAHPERFRQGEERRVSHILIQAARDGDAAALKAAKEKAEALLKQVKANPADFARLAKENSQDPGSAEKGGDLGFFARGAMVKPFEDAAFGLAKEGDMSDVVQSDFGFHIIRLSGIKAEKARAFDEVKAEILGELKRAEAGKRFAEMAEGFTNTVYEQADSLKPAAEKYKLQIRTSEWIAQGGRAPAPFDNPKLLAALFSDDAVKNKRNTDAIEVAKGTLVTARVVEHKPASVKAFEEVKADIDKVLTLEEAVVLAEKDGVDKLAKLGKGEALELQWGAAHPIQRVDQRIPPEVLRTIFRAPVDKLPAYAGAKVQGVGYVLFRIEKVTRPVASGKDDPRMQALRQQYGRVLAEEEFSAYLGALRKRYDVKVNAAKLEQSK
ncbi:SurA N-terminal domain-containing protein [Zoogloea dura]|uniref:Periplasmic chaperone PpiD n=1 Tax=Zoogloea dura TaxID=2728840 RepID=A0A848FZI2_9RHOO|nr:SurA N-terminal domain-containing protein [Zoogloea dura]NML24215.1 peptidylprolyl isomerase [Zoogloea dura]